MQVQLSGMCFGMSSPGDSSQYLAKPFKVFCSYMQVAPELHTHAPFSHIQFSADGKLMLCVAEGHVYQLDAFNGSLQQTYSTGVPPGALGLGAIFSPDSNYILSGLFVLHTVLLWPSCKA